MTRREYRKLLGSRLPWPRPIRVAMLFGALISVAVASLPVRSTTSRAMVDDVPEVSLAQNRLIGQRLPSGVERFAGVAYALPPVGDRRWTAAQAPKGSSEIRLATRAGPDCMQFSTMVEVPHPEKDFFFHPPSVMSEDCLYLNLWTPSRSGRKHPVMIWLHGGGSVQGSGAHPLYDGENLARKGVVLITFNYRLGIFGRFAHRSLSSESKAKTSGNYDLSDILQLLHWVRQNVAKFGGDPDRVTLFGESAGGSYVTALLAMPAASGLFHRAIAQSGTVFSLTYPTLKQSEAAGAAFASYALRPDIAALRQMPAEDLLAMSRTDFTPSLTVDGHLMPRQPCAALAAGSLAKVPLIVGFNSGELYGTKVFDGINGPDSYEQRVLQIYGENARVLLALYPKQQWRTSVRSLSSHGLMAILSENLASAMPTQSYLYYFDQSLTKAAVAYHTSEVPFVFNNVKLDARYSPNMPEIPKTPENIQLAEDLSDMWVRFAATGSPNLSPRLSWPTYSGSGKATFVRFTRGRIFIHSKLSANPKLQCTEGN